MSFRYEWRGDFDNATLESLHAEAFSRTVIQDDDWKTQVEQHSLGWVCAREGDELVGFVNVAWDGGSHAFVLDTLVTERVRRLGVGTQLVAVAVTQARAAGCEWLHVDFEDHLRTTPADSGRRTQVSSRCRPQPRVLGAIDLTFTWIPQESSASIPRPSRRTLEECPRGTRRSSSPHR